MPTNLYDSLMERMDGQPYSNYFACFCPFENHKTPALLVYDDGLFVCLSCHRKGTHAQLEKKIGTHYHPKIRNTVSRVLPQWRKWEEQYDDLDGIVYHAHQSLKRNPVFQSYFKSRKIHEYIEDGNLGYLDGWAIFPVYSHQHKLLDIVVRATNNKGTTRYVVAPSDSSEVRPLYVPSWKNVDQADVVYVVYGLIDSISLHLAGLPSVTGITGKSLHAELLRPLRKRFIIVPDEGEEQEAHVLANQLGWRARVKELSYPDGTKDPDGIRKEYGNTALLNLLGA